MLNAEVAAIFPVGITVFRNLNSLKIPISDEESIVLRTFMLGKYGVKEERRINLQASPHFLWWNTNLLEMLHVVFRTIFCSQFHQNHPKMSRKNTPNFPQKYIFYHGEIRQHSMFARGFFTRRQSFPRENRGCRPFGATAFCCQTVLKNQVFYNE